MASGSKVSEILSCWAFGLVNMRAYLELIPLFKKRWVMRKCVNGIGGGVDVYPFEGSSNYYKIQVFASATSVAQIDRYSWGVVSEMIKAE